MPLFSIRACMNLVSLDIKLHHNASLPYCGHRYSFAPSTYIQTQLNLIHLLNLAMKSGILSCCRVHTAVSDTNHWIYTAARAAPTKTSDSMAGVGQGTASSSLPCLFCIRSCSYILSASYRYNSECYVDLAKGRSVMAFSFFKPVGYKRNTQNRNALRMASGVSALDF